MDTGGFTPISVQSHPFFGSGGPRSTRPASRGPSLPLAAPSVATGESPCPKGQGDSEDLPLSIEPMFAVKVYRAEDGGYWAECPELPGYLTQGETLAALRRNAQEAVMLYLETLAQSVPKPGPPHRHGRPAATWTFTLAPA
jgi:predicted RNase H-like HicB family nuclease